LTEKEWNLADLLDKALVVWINSLYSLFVYLIHYILDFWKTDKAIFTKWSSNDSWCDTYPWQSLEWAYWFMRWFWEWCFGYHLSCSSGSFDDGW
jgi:hypothetical protein